MPVITRHCRKNYSRRSKYSTHICGKGQHSNRCPGKPQKARHSCQGMKIVCFAPCCKLNTFFAMCARRAGGTCAIGSPYTATRAGAGPVAAVHSC